jgi:hypothetical protein
MTKSLKIVVLGLVAAIALTGCSKGDDNNMDTTTTTTESTESMPDQSVEGSQKDVGTIVDVAVSNPDFSTLVAALGAADLVTTLSSEGPFTVFAPTNEAFAALPAGLLDALLLPENKAILTQILTYHVVSGKVMAADVTDSDVATVEGSTVTLSTMNGVTVNGANVVMADVESNNGVIHAIDAVILPAGVDVTKLLKK